MPHFVGIADGKGDVWGVRVPDMPGCYGGGATPEAAIQDVIRAMSIWADASIEEGREIPTARQVTDVLADPETEYDAAAGETIVLLPLVREAGGPVKATISLNAGILAAIDAAATARGMTRSGFIAAAAKAMIEKQAI